MGELSKETVFIDGTKLESCANKILYLDAGTISKAYGRRTEIALSKCDS
ncbi:hypothetical protein acsn021_13680 [Anaerocolumna cellulosilytica]|uniref:Uncharacterized protein n=1 Tax=Anaerocolumna cellulosilytica TaxID=433286 RepID=A0A6S6QXL3_9FIRM|nr:hypothetical protein acsn021_13680 [Anaerocolumna cellulosilytica]